jgi:succinyl-CoA synthetase alpha subunit
MCDILKKTLVKTNLYSDSVALMRISNKVASLPAVQDVLVGMATELNLELLAGLDALTDEARAAGPNDLIIAVVASDQEALDAAFAEVDALFAKKHGDNSSTDTRERSYRSIREALARDVGYNMAEVSVPGAYAAYECRVALENDLHVFLFSDNVTVEEEIALKDLANRRGLLMMGPDCGTAIINGVPLGFANVVREGPIGIVAASGTGLQHVTCLIDALGSGISQAIGVGGRDLSSAVGGRTMLAALDAIGADPATRVVVILSKPPAPEVAAKVWEKARDMGKPVVICLFGREPADALSGVVLCADMEQTAIEAVALATADKAGGRPQLADPFFSRELPESFAQTRLPQQRFVRGIFCGGTVCDEAMVTFRACGLPISSNIPLADDERLADVHVSEGNTFIDMGDDYFTRGKPHPMIEPSLRNQRIIDDALLPDTAVMLLDVELGYGSHPDPAGVLLEAVTEAKRRLGERQLLWIASIVGTAGDPQGLEDQAERLREAGFVVTLSNVRAARLAAEIVQNAAAATDSPVGAVQNAKGGSR